MIDKARLAEQVSATYDDFSLGLDNKRRYPTEQFARFFSAVKAYAEATRGDEMIHRSVAKCVNGLHAYLQLERRKVPGQVLADADRLAVLLFAGYDPYFEGEEPPGL